MGAQVIIMPRRKMMKTEISDNNEFSRLEDELIDPIIANLEILLVYGNAALTCNLFARTKRTASCDGRLTKPVRCVSCYSSNDSVGDDPKANGHTVICTSNGEVFTCGGGHEVEDCAVLGQGDLTHPSLTSLTLVEGLRGKKSARRGSRRWHYDLLYR